MGEVLKMEKTVNSSVLRLDKYGIPISNSIFNVKTLLLNADVFTDNLAFNDFTQEPEVINDFYLNGTLIAKGEIKPNFEDILGEYFETELDVVFKPSTISSGLNIFWDVKKYNPVKDYMEQALTEWDGKERLKSVFSYWLGAEENKVTETIAKVFFTSAVAKVYEPLTKVDTVLDLVGGQGVGKTSFLSKIGKDWYTSNAVNFTDKDSYNVMLKALIVNDDEMTASKRMNFEETKSFISKTVLEFRKSYDRRGSTYAKNFVIARTTNNLEYLKDATGDRRFMPILAEANNQKKHPMDMQESDIIQIWGEAVSLYKDGYDLASFDKLGEERIKYQEKFTNVDPLNEEIERYLDLLLPEEWNKLNVTQQRQLAQSLLNGFKYQAVEDGTYQLTTKQDFTTLKEIAYNVFNKDTTDKRMIARIKIYMDNHPNFKNSRKKIGNSYLRGYKRIEE
ncbi:hypothetical protein SG586P1_00044 [Streptococcus phage SG586P1]|nr:hypothetical protein SG586P1_00044 [Streptococcus phage SG586P1]WAX18049.1 hypothetical protein SG586P3_00044 [Streptococcus phage SG586P3]